MKAVVFDRAGPPETVLQVRDVPKPTPKRGEVLVRMLASPVNPSDLTFIGGQYVLNPSFPATPGFEGLGVVEASGGGVLGWLRNGKRVAVVGNPAGLWAEYAVTASRLVIPIPDEIPDDQAAGFFINPATAVAMTKSVLKISPAEWLLQTAAGSALGKIIIRLAKAEGFRTINVVRRREQVEELKKLGADAVLVESDGPLSEQIKKYASEGVRYAIDCVGGETGSQAVACLTSRGRMLVYGSLTGEPIRLHPRALIGGGQRIEGFWLGAWAKSQSVPRMLRLFRTMRRLFREGVAGAEIAKSYSLDQVREAVTHAAAAGKGGKILLRVQS